MMVCTSSRAVGVQFYRTLMLVVLGLCVVALLFGPELVQVPGMMLLAGSVFAFVGFMVWTLGRSDAGRWISAALLVFTSVALIWPTMSSDLERGWMEKLIAAGEAVTSALLLGSMMAAMLLGHSYLIAPAMSIEPLKRLVIWIAASVAGRAALAGVLLIVPGSGWNGGSLDSFWWSLLAARWVVGLVGPAVIAWMVWQTARIRSTQSATGILYAGVILTFFGELVSQLLTNHTGAAS